MSRDYVNSEDHGVATDVDDFAKRIGVDNENEESLVDIVALGSKVSLPPDWRLTTIDGDIVYRNTVTREIRFEHPLDANCKLAVTVSRDKGSSHALLRDIVEYVDDDCLQEEEPPIQATKTSTTFALPPRTRRVLDKKAVSPTLMEDQEPEVVQKYEHEVQEAAPTVDNEVKVAPDAAEVISNRKDSRRLRRQTSSSIFQLVQKQQALQQAAERNGADEVEPIEEVDKKSLVKDPKPSDREEQPPTDDISNIKESVGHSHRKARPRITESSMHDGKIYSQCLNARHLRTTETITINPTVRHPRSTMTYAQLAGICINVDRDPLVRANRFIENEMARLRKFTAPNLRRTTSMRLNSSPKLNSSVVQSRFADRRIARHHSTSSHCLGLPVGYSLYSDDKPQTKSTKHLKVSKLL